jgi:glutathionyl-hydroquinone reductase
MAQEVVTAPNKDGKDIYNYPSKDGTFKRQISSFRDFVSDAPGAKFPPEKGRYVRSSVLLLSLVIRVLVLEMALIIKFDRSCIST